MSNGLFIGLMSGTSVDGIDCALVEIKDTRVKLLQTLQLDIPPAVREQVASLSHSGPGEIEQLGVLDRKLGSLFAQASLDLLESAGKTAGEITAIGSHGQTIRHRPPSGGHSHQQSFTLQIGDPNTIAEMTGITTVADFRRRDMAAGGEGAPLAPAFHEGAFAQEHSNRAIIQLDLALQLGGSIAAIAGNGLAGVAIKNLRLAIIITKEQSIIRCPRIADDQPWGIRIAAKIINIDIARQHQFAN